MSRRARCPIPPTAEVGERGGGHATPQILIVLSGPVCAGKTTLANALERCLDAQVVRARDVIREHTRGQTRRSLQLAGAELELATGGAWLASAARKVAVGEGVAVVDAVRTRVQMVSLRALPVATVHVSLHASWDARRARYAARQHPADAGLSFVEAVTGEDELEIEGLARVSDLKVDTTQAEVRATLTTLLDYLQATS